MSRRTKWIALIGCGGLVAQLTSCVPIIADLLLQEVFILVVQALIGGLSGGAA
ncbi:MAG: hypothetical protein HRU75_06395 [Planctomycetia bacterium]|nr:MAG: hypothetical protein HRU75_06395 [Planctomycetia bacterium]